MRIPGTMKIHHWFTTLTLVYATLQVGIFEGFRIYDIDLGGDSPLATNDHYRSLPIITDQNRRLRTCDQTPLVPPLPSGVEKNINITSSNFRIAQKPLFGKHRCVKDAILAFAHGYELHDVIHFIASLARTKFDGDLVLGVGSDIKEDFRAILEYYAEKRPGFVVYEISLDCETENFCKSINMFEEQIEGSWQPMPNSRPFSRVSVLRYEYYWAWANQYSSSSLLFLTDARDVFFQRNPMDDALLKDLFTGTEDQYGTLVFFEEADKIRFSTGNSAWLRSAYSKEVYEELKDKMIICSGTTLGSKPAIETYAKAMVQEFDKTECEGNRCKDIHDQGLHNYLIYKNRLIGQGDTHKISNIVVHAQGEGGIVNTMGLLVLNSHKTMQRHGLIRKSEVLDNDRKTVSAVVHMYDRDESLNNEVNFQFLKDYMFLIK